MHGRINVIFMQSIYGKTSIRAIKKTTPKLAQSHYHLSITKYFINLIDKLKYLWHLQIWRKAQ